MKNVRSLHPEDETGLSVLLVSTFGQPNELNLVKDLRAQGHMALELVAEDDGGLTGYICMSWLVAPEHWLALGPMCVRNESQNTGIGTALTLAALDAARKQNAEAITVVGEPRYYHRHGFVFGGPVQVTTPYPAEFTGLYIVHPQPQRFDVTLVYPAPFATV